MESPNIFLFVMDTARAKSCSAYGYDRDTTPFLEECAEKGFKFENAIANSIWTYPSHVSMFTGMYPHEHERISKYDKGEIFFDSFVENLSEENYYTVGISNNGWISSMFGFDEFFDDFSLNTTRKDFLLGHDSLLREFEKKNRKDVWDSKLSKYKDFITRAFRERRTKSVLNGIYYVFYNQVIEKLVEEDIWMDSGSKEILGDINDMDFDSSKPSFVFVNFIEPHNPYTPPIEFARKFHEGDIEDAKEILRTNPSSYLGQNLEKEEKVFRDFYDASLNYMDHMLKRIHDKIEENTKRDNVFIFVGDHGEMFNADGLWEHHGGFRREVVRVPLIVKGHEEGREEEIFELKDMEELVYAVVKGESFDLGSEEAFSDYLGLDSHMLKDDLPEGFNNPKAARITADELEVVSSLEDAEGRLKEHLRALKMKKNRNNL